GRAASPRRILERDPRVGPSRLDRGRWAFPARGVRRGDPRCPRGSVGERASQPDSEEIARAVPFAGSCESRAHREMTLAFPALVQLTMCRFPPAVYLIR